MNYEEFIERFEELVKAEKSGAWYLRLGTKEIRFKKNGANRECDYECPICFVANRSQEEPKFFDSIFAADAGNFLRLDKDTRGLVIKAADNITLSPKQKQITKVRNELRDIVGV